MTIRVRYSTSHRLLPKWTDLGVHDKALVGVAAHRPNGDARGRERLDALRHARHRVLAQLHLRAHARTYSIIVLYILPVLRTVW